MFSLTNFLDNYQCVCVGWGGGIFEHLMEKQYIYMSLESVVRKVNRIVILSTAAERHKKQ